ARRAGAGRHPVIRLRAGERPARRVPAPPATRLGPLGRDRLRDVDAGRADRTGRSRRDRPRPSRRSRSRAARRPSAAGRGRLARRSTSRLRQTSVTMADFLDEPTRSEGPPAADERADAASQIARLAGKIALDYFQRTEVSWKPDDSMVTEADVVIQGWLEDEIARPFPGDGILGEQGLSRKPRRLGSGFVWVLDPVDGTNNVGRGIPGFAISIGVLRDGMPFAGAVYDPSASQLFTACAGHGAWLNGRRLRVEDAVLGPRSLFSIRAPFSGDVPRYVQRWLGRHRLRRFGSAPPQLCYVATGALAFVHDHRTCLWDIAGAAVGVSEAGGILTTEEGAPLFPIDPDAYGGEPIAVLAGDPTGHRQSLTDIRGGLV